MYLKFYEYSTLYLEQNIPPVCVIEVLDSKRVLNTKRLYVIHGKRRRCHFHWQGIITVLKRAVDNVILELYDSCDYFAGPLLVQKTN